jgi:hypothetical protein
MTRTLPCDGIRNSALQLTRAMTDSVSRHCPAVTTCQPTVLNWVGRGTSGTQAARADDRMMGRRARRSAAWSIGEMLAAEPPKSVTNVTIDFGTVVI